MHDTTLPIIKQRTKEEAKRTILTLFIALCFCYFVTIYNLYEKLYSLAILLLGNTFFSSKSMTKSKSTTKGRAKGLLLLNLAVAIYLFATGIMGIMGIMGRMENSEILVAVHSIFPDGGDFATILIVILSVMAIAAGVFLLIRIFGISVSNTETLLIILAVTWLIFILMIDIIPHLSKKNEFNLYWLKTFGSHVMVLAGIILGTKKFGV
jgi:hypothetical protein